MNITVEAKTTVTISIGSSDEFEITVGEARALVHQLSTAIGLTDSSELAKGQRVRVIGPIHAGYSGAGESLTWTAGRVTETDIGAGDGAEYYVEAEEDGISRPRSGWFARSSLEAA